MERWTWFRTLAALVTLVVLMAGAGAVALSGVGGYTLTLWRPVTLHAGLDLGGGVRLILRARPSPGQRLDDRVMERERTIIAARIGYATDLAEPSVRVARSGGDRLIEVEWAGAKADVPTLQDLVQQRGRFAIVGIVGATPRHPIMKKCGSTGPSSKITDLTGDPAAGYPVLAHDSDLIPASVAFGTNVIGGSPAVDAALTAPAAARVAAAPFPYLGVAIDGTIYDVRLRSHMLPLANQFQIADTTGSVCVKTRTTTTTTVHLVAKLKYGVLPVALQTTDVREIGPIVDPSHTRGVGLITLVAFVIVAFALIARHKVLGALAVASLLVAALVAGAVVKLFALPLTGAGLVGFALAVVVAADEHRAVIVRARASLDAAAALLIACVILWWVGTTQAVDVLVDFAMALFIGVAASTATMLLLTWAVTHLSLLAIDG